MGIYHETERSQAVTETFRRFYNNEQKYSVLCVNMLYYVMYIGVYTPTEIRYTYVSVRSK